jgi:hypothetical protein
VPVEPALEATSALRGAAGGEDFPVVRVDPDGPDDSPPADTDNNILR